jgi:hypothetical protein
LIFINENGISVQPHGQAYITGVSMSVLVPRERIEKTILVIRGHKVIVDADLAELYGVSTKVLNQAVKRNGDRFPNDFIFRLTKQEKLEVVTNCDHLRKLKFSPAQPFAISWHRARQIPPHRI